MKDHPSQWIASGLTCRDVTDAASDYLENRLTLFTKIRMGLHLVSCPGCRAYLRQLAVVCEALQGLPQLYPSPINRLRLRQRFSALHATAS